MGTVIVTIQTDGDPEVAEITTTPQEEGEPFVDGAGITRYGKVEAFIDAMLDGRGLDEKMRIVTVLTAKKKE